MINNLVVATTTIQSDTNATNNTLVERDSAGGIYGKNVQGTTVTTTGNLVVAVSTQTASFTAGAAVNYLVDCTAGAVTVTLPLASSSAGVEYSFIKKDSSGNAVTLSGVLGTGTISSQYGKVKVFCDGTNWYSV